MTEDLFTRFAGVLGGERPAVDESPPPAPEVVIDMELEGQVHAGLRLQLQPVELVGCSAGCGRPYVFSTPTVCYWCRPKEEEVH